MADGKYSVKIGEQEIFLQRWSFFQREQGYGLFPDIQTAFANQEQRRGRVLQFQLLGMTLGHQEVHQTERFIQQQAELLKDKSEQEAQQEVYKKFIEAIYLAEHDDYLRSIGVDPETLKKAEEDKKKTKNPKGTSDPAT